MFVCARLGHYFNKMKIMFEAQNDVGMGGIKINNVKPLTLENIGQKREAPTQ